MTALVIFPDTDTLARKYLLQGLAEHGTTGIAVGTKLPSRCRTGSFVASPSPAAPCPAARSGAK
jgi:hypothetical protein